MVVVFTDDIDPLLVETVSDKEEKALGFDDNGASMAASEISMSEFDGPASALPQWCLFGPKECQCIFVMNSDKWAVSICPGCVAQSEKNLTPLNTSTTPNTPDEGTGEDERGDILIRCFWARGTNYILDVHVTDTDAKSYAK